MKTTIYDLRVRVKGGKGSEWEMGDGVNETKEIQDKEFVFIFPATCHLFIGWESIKSYSGELFVASCSTWQPFAKNLKN